MERVIFAVFYVIGKLLCMLIELPFWLFERQPKAEPLSLPLEPRLEHTHIVAGSGHGKTQLLQHLIVTHDLADSGVAPPTERNHPTDSSRGVRARFRSLPVAADGAIKIRPKYALLGMI